MRILFALFALVASTAAAQAQNRWVTIENVTGVTMLEFHASNRDQRTWGRDWLGSSVLYSGNSVEFNIDDGSGYCLYDLQAIFVDGDEVTAMSFNVCERATATFR